MQRILTLLSCLALCGCAKHGSKPDAAADAFLRAVRQQQCEKVWTFFSAASQARIREESERVTREQPYYAEQFKPQNLYCTSTYANRFGSCTPGSARLISMRETSAVVTVLRREGKDFLIPGFFPTKFTNVPVELNMVLENGSWKIDLVTPTSEYVRAEAARQRALNKERQMMEEWQRRRDEAMRQQETNSSKAE